MRLVVLALSLVTFLSAQTVEVVADKFFADEKKQVSEFTGNVVVTKGTDKLVAKKVVITFDKNRQPLKYVASGDAKIDMTMHDKVYFGSAQTMVYEPVKDQYTLIKDAFLHEKITNKKVYGEKIFVNQTTGRYEVESDGKKPVKFIFKVDEKKKK
jgi:lipopolysaccharide export system protein LptA